MSRQKKRSYNSAGRQEKAVETKRRILTAAKKLFQEKGYEPVTIDEIAKAARISSPTIFLLYKSKRGIFQAIMDDALPSGQREALVAEVNKEPSARGRLQFGAKIARQMYDAERTLMDLFRGASVLSPELKEIEIERELRRYERQGPSMRKTAKDKSLIKGLTLKKARDIVWAFTGRDMYRLFVIERGWTSDQYEKWLSEVLIKSILK